MRDLWGTIDFALHAIAFAPKEDLHGRLTDCSRDGFLQAMDISCHSFLRMARLAEPVMPNGGALFTMSYYGAEKVVERAAERAPARRLVDIEDVGAATAVLATDYAKLITGETVYVDGGYHVLG
jgi:enoyl-[acyl-carrier protein] reductase I